MLQRNSLTNHLDTALLELLRLAGNLTELGGADGGEVIGVGEEDSPRATEPLVEVDNTPAAIAERRRQLVSEPDLPVVILHCAKVRQTCGWDMNKRILTEWSQR